MLRNVSGLLRTLFESLRNILGIAQKCLGELLKTYWVDKGALLPSPLLVVNLSPELEIDTAGGNCT